MNSYETVNNILVELFKDILDIEERALITSEYKDISVNDMHIMERNRYTGNQEYVYSGQNNVCYGGEH